MRCLVLLLCLLPIVSLSYSLEANIDCPNIANVNEEFVCNVDVNSVEDSYDLKIYLKNDENKGINRIWEEDEFRRADWYLIDFIEESGEYEVKLLINKEYSGVSTGEFKLRDSNGKIVINENFEIEIQGGNEENAIKEGEEEKEDISKEEEESEEEILTKEEEEKKEKKNSNDDDDDEREVLSGKISGNVVEESDSKRVINLNLQEDFKKETVVYKSKSERVKDYMIYAFIFFLIFIIGLLLVERRW